MQDPNWYKAKRADGREGMIPFNYVQKKENVSNNFVGDKAGRRKDFDPPSPGPPTRDKDVMEKRRAVKLHTMP